MRESIFKSIKNLVNVGRYAGVTFFKINKNKVILSWQDYVIYLPLFVVFKYLSFLSAKQLFLYLLNNNRRHFIFSEIVFHILCQLARYLFIYQGIVQRKAMKKIIENTNVTDVRLNNNDLRNTTFTKYILLVPFLINSIYWVIVTPFLNYQHTGRTYISVINKTEEMINCLLMELNLVINHRLKYQLRTINYRLKKDIEYVTFIKKQFKEGILQIEDLNDKIDIKINDIKQQLHLRWCVNKTSMDTKKAFEIGIIATLAVATCSLTVVIDYGLYLSLFNTFSWRIFFKLIGLLTELTKDMAVLMVIISSWTMIEKEATETGPLIHEFWNSVIDLESSTKSAEFLKLASLHIIYTTPSFSILNILQLNWDAMSAIVNIAVTYSTSFLQLQLNAMRNRKNLL